MFTATFLNSTNRFELRFDEMIDDNAMHLERVNITMEGVRRELRRGALVVAALLRYVNRSTAKRSSTRYALSGRKRRKQEWAVIPEPRMSS